MMFVANFLLLNLRVFCVCKIAVLKAPVLKKGCFSSLSNYLTFYSHSNQIKFYQKHKNIHFSRVLIKYLLAPVSVDGYNMVSPF